MSALPNFVEFESAASLDAHAPRSGALELAASANIKRLKAGETLYVEGEAAPYCYQVASGVVKEYNTLKDGRRQVADFYSVGELFGISELGEQMHTAETITDCAIRSYPRETFLNAVESDPTLSHQFLCTLMHRLHRARERMVLLGRMSALQRISAFLMRLAGEQKTSYGVRFFMSRQDIADHLGLTIETVCRALTELKKRRVIVMPSPSLFSIPDSNALAACANGSENPH